VNPARHAQPEADVLVAAFYHFVPLPDFRAMRGPLRQRCAELGLMGTILLAEEGINGTVAGPKAGVRAMMSELRADTRFVDLEFKLSRAREAPFYRMKVRLKKEIVSLGVDSIDPRREVGEYVPPRQWNALIARPEVRVVDTRNDYEVHLGSFEGAENPETRSGWRKTSIRSGTSTWRCSAPAASAVRRPPPTSSSRASGTSITSKAGSSITWKQWIRPKAPGGATASYSTIGSRWTTNCVKATLRCARPAGCRLLRRTGSRPGSSCTFPAPSALTG
jgi:hypothetical protein